jgi:amino acid transporter
VLYATSWIVAGLDLAVQLLLALLGLVLVFDVDRLTATLDLGVAPTWNAVAYSVPIAMVSFAGIEVVAALLRETKEPGQALARDTVLAVVTTIVVYAVLAVVALSAFPVKPVDDAPSGYAGRSWASRRC